MELSTILMGGYVRFLRVFCLVEQKVCLMVRIKEPVKETKVSCTSRFSPAPNLGHKCFF
jgi:hypothetical protein